MRRTLAVIVLTTAALLGLPSAAQAGGPTSVLITSPSDESATALYYGDAEYAQFERLLASGSSVGHPRAEAASWYRLTWMVHDVTPWRLDEIRVEPDGGVIFSTSNLIEGGVVDGVPTWRRATDPKALLTLLDRVFAGQRTITREAPADTAPAITSPAPVTPEAAPAAESRWFTIEGWRWALPGALAGLLVGALASRRRVEDSAPRQQLVDRREEPVSLS